MMAKLSSGWVLIVLDLLFSFTCRNQATTRELLEANFLSKGQAAIDLLSPTQDQQLKTANPTFSWSSRGVALYTLQLATDSAFTNTVLTKEINGTTYTVVNSDLTGMSSLTTNTYYWRVKVAKLTDNLQSKMGSFLLVAIPATGNGYAGVMYVDVNSTSSVQIGSKNAPYKTIQGAISGANALRDGNASITMDIYVAKGTYTEEATLAPGISIRGGYEPAAWTRDIAGNVTSVSAPTDAAMRGNSQITALHKSTTVVEGLNIRGGNSAGINYGIFLNNSSPLITNNTIYGGSGTAGTGQNYGIYASASSSPTIVSNNISGGNSPGECYGIYTDNSSPDILNNTIDGGPCTNYTHGIKAYYSSPSISGNTISAGSGNGITYAMHCTNGTPSITNNTISGGDAAGNNYGIYILSSSPLIFNNTINGGTSGPATGITFGPAAAAPNIQNNIIFNSTGAGTCVRENSANPATIQNNNLFGCATLYADGTAGNLTAICGTGNFGLAGCGTVLSTPTGSGNVSISNAGNQLFANQNGADGNAFTLSDNDWHLTTNAAICDVRGGGQNLSGSFTTDKDGMTRTISAISGCTPANTGATNWSMGALESN